MLPKISHKIILLFLVNYFKLNSIYCDHNIVFSDQQYFEGDYCNRQSDDASGECKLITYCPTAQEIYRKYKITPDICEFKYNLPVVCCSNANLYYEQDYTEIDGNHRNHLRHGISSRKCQEYERIAVNLKNYQRQEYTKLTIDLPHLAAIGWTKNNYTNWKCDGSLISKNFILTSASCLASNDVIPDLVKFLAQAQQVTPENLKYFRITEIVNYPDYKRNSFYHDLALIKIHKNVRFTINIRPACLWRINNIYSASVLFSKWNLIFGATNDDVQQQYVQTLDINDCAQYINPNEQLNYGISYNQICTRGYYTSSNNKIIDPSGGTIQISFQNGRQSYYIIGVGSYDISWRKGGPLVFTRISSYISWIEGNVWPNNN